MRRTLLIAMIPLLSLTACGNTHRAEGIVERWLQSIDQGKAGTPEKYATDEVSQQVLPGFRDLDPGQFDVIEVGRGEMTGSGPGKPAVSQLAVPFRVVDQHGNEFRGNALLAEGSQEIVSVVRESDPAIPLPSEGGPPIAAMAATSWLGGIGVGVGFIALGVGLMVLVRRSSNANLQRA